MPRPPAPPRDAPAAPVDDGPPDRSNLALQPIKSERLFCGATELQIEHRGSVYRLRQTSLGKLILTK